MVCEVLRMLTTVLAAVARCITVCGTLELAAGWLDVCFPQIGWNKFSVCDTLPRSVSLQTQNGGLFNYRFFSLYHKDCLSNFT